jgi:REP element-mobilizing transposase RayT
MMHVKNETGGNNRARETETAAVGAGHAREKTGHIGLRRAHGALLQEGIDGIGRNRIDTAAPANDRKPPGHLALRRGRVSLPNQAYLVTTATAKRQRFFLDFRAACAAAGRFEDRATLGDAHMPAWVLMPDHVHWLLQLGQQDRLETVVNRLKSGSARCANRALGRQGALWARGFHDHALRSEENLRDVARYIIANPVRAGLAARVGDYPFWNAVWV